MLLFLAISACSDPEVQSQLDALQSQVDAQEATIEALQSRLAAAEGANESQDSDIASLQGVDDLHDQDLSGLRADVDANTSDIFSQGEELDTLHTRLTAAETTLSSVQGVASGVEPLLDYLTVDTAEHSVVFEGANVYVQSGSGDTDGAVNGLGNLIVGYDEGDPADKTGSHNLVVGYANTYTSYAGVVFGGANTVSGEFASVLGGVSNTASGDFSAVLGGSGNEASGDYSTVYGGYHLDATTSHSYAP